MVITDYSYLGNRFSGPQIASDAYDNFLKKKGGGSTGSNPTRRQKKKATKALRKQGLAPKKPGLFGKRRAATGINSPSAKSTGLFGIQDNSDASIPDPPIADAPAASSEPSEGQTPAPNNQAEALANGASNDLDGISDKTPAADQNLPKADAGQDAPAPEPGSGEEQYFSYELEQWPRARSTRRNTSYDSFDEPKEPEKKDMEKKKKISVGAVLGLLGAAVAGALAMYVVISAGEKTGQPTLNPGKHY